MEFLLTIFAPSSYIEFPQGPVGWAGWLTLAAFILWINWKWRGFNKRMRNRERLLLMLFALAVPLTSFFIGIRFSPGAALPLPDIPYSPQGAASLIFSALPWFLAAGLLGPGPAAILALLSGLLIALWDTHNPFTPLEAALLASLFGAMVNQRYRTMLFQLIRHPIGAAALLSVLYPFIAVLDTPFVARGLLASRLDFALTHLSGASLATAIELMIAGVFCEVIAVSWPKSWGGQGPLIPSPAESSLQARFLYNMAPLAILLALTLVVGDWFIAGNAARNMLRGRMATAAEMAATSVPYFLDTGQNLIVQFASDPRLNAEDAGELSEVLEQALRSVTFFHQLYLLDADGKLKAGYPDSFYVSRQAPVEEQTGVQLALNGIPPVQYYSIPSPTDMASGLISFVATVPSEAGNGVLIGRADLESNPFTKPLIESLNQLADIGGEGVLLDEYGRILYHPDPEMVMTEYALPEVAAQSFFDDTAPNGTRRLVYFQPVEGRDWSVLINVPASQAQQQALNIAAPLLAVILLVSLLSVIVLRFGLEMVTSSLKTLAQDAGRISKGQLNIPMMVDGEDEVGHLRRAFEQMRLSLKARLDELNRLLMVSQGVASSLEMEEAVQPVLESAIASGASTARVVLVPSVVPELDGGASGPSAFGLGPSSDLYKYLDEQVLNLTRRQERLVLTNPTRPRLLSYTPGAPRPESLLAIALRHENRYYGALWLAYDDQHTFSDEEVRFFITLAGQAALAAANASLFMTAEIGRQRLAAILASTPDPVLVTDQRDRLLLSNLAAWRALGLSIQSDEGQPIEKVIKQKELLDLLRMHSEEKESVEVKLPDGQIYLATASSVMAEGQRVGRVCAMRDITHFKELDALKSEFVSTVSHDLRSPLTLMRGYATMLEMVGELNEQQTNYVRKIVSGVESMSRLVNNLLDLGRIEAGIGLQLELVPVQDTIERVTGSLQLQASQKRIQIEVDVPSQTIPLVEADQALLQQALQNLVENAIKYTPPEGKIKVCVQTRQDRMVFEVIDTGIGVSPMDQPRLFEKFYRGAQQISKEQRGTGLGLAIVKSIAERHGGQVWVESQLGKGSKFYLSIPLRQNKMALEKI